MPELSVIIPVFNEEKNVKILINEFNKVFKKKSLTNIEVIFVNDGSNDGTGKIKIKNKKIRLLNLKKNYGQSIAIQAGIENTFGKYICIMDGDLQSKPEDIIKLYKEIKKNKLDFVLGYRLTRNDNILRKFFSSIGNFLIRKIIKTKIRDLGCSLKIIKRDQLKDIKVYGDMHRYISIFLESQGSKYTQIPVKHEKRIYGISKYGFNRVYKVIGDIFYVSYHKFFFYKPMQFFGYFSFLFLILASTFFAYSVYLKIFKKISFILTPLIPASFTFLILSLVTFCIGILGELLCKTYVSNNQNRKIYKID